MARYTPKHSAARTPAPAPEAVRPGRHRAEPVRRPGVDVARAVRTAAIGSGLAAVATGATIAGGVLGSPPLPVAVADLAGTALTESPQPEAQAEASLEPASDRAEAVVSRSDRRGSRDAVKVAALSLGTGPAVQREESLADADPREIGRALLPEYGFSADQFSCLDALYVSESDWRVDADNPTSSAYGIPQALTETHDLPPGYMTSAEVQIRWGLDYIASRYGTPCSAWGFKQGNGWY